MKILKYIYRISLVSWLLFLSIILIKGNPEDPTIKSFHFYLKNREPYVNLMDVFNVLFHLENYTINFFEWCCDCINFIGRLIGYNYEIMNILLFVIILPGLLINLFIIALFQFLYIRKIETK
jgi:hypothetical protein